MRRSGESGPAFSLNPFARMRDEAFSLLRLGYDVASLSALIAVVGFMYWCPRCGMWMGEGSEGQGPNAPKPEIPPPPARLIKAISEPPRQRPIPTQDRQSPSVAHNELWRDQPYRGQLHSVSPWKDHNGEPAKEQYHPPSPAHGRRRDTYWGGYPEPDARPHAHLTEFIRGDGQVVGAGGDADAEKRLYERPKQGPADFDSGVFVEQDPATGVYIWGPRR